MKITEPVTLLLTWLMYHAEESTELELHLILGAILLVLMLADIAIRKLQWKRK